jgi:hypothetical protein
MKITKQQLKKIIKEELSTALNENDSIDQPLVDFWMNELNSALLYSMDAAGVGNSMMPSKFLEAILPVLEAYGSGAEAKKMVDHVRSNQDLYSPGRPVAAPDPPDPDKPIRTSYSAEEIFGLSKEPNR